jgi:hypothetical protein
MTAHDDLRHQLLESVAARGSTAPAPRRFRRRGRGLAVALAALAVGGGVAGAATQLLSGPQDGARARALVRKVVAETRRMPACSPGEASFVDTAPLAPIEAVFPSRSGPLAPAARTLVERYAMGQVLARTVRLLRLPYGRRILVFATRGATPRPPADADACNRAQGARLLALHPAGDGVQRLAVELLRAAWQRQFLSIWLVDARHAGGTGIPVVAGRPLPTHIVLGGSDGYAGIARPGADGVLVTSANPAVRYPLHREFAVRQRLFAFSLPPNTGPVEVRQQTREGKTLSVETIRR